MLLMLTLSSSLSLLLSLSCLFYFIVKSVPRKFAERLERSGAAAPPSRCAPRAPPQDDLGAGAPQYPRLPGSSPQGSSAFCECPPHMQTTGRTPQLLPPDSFRALP